MKNFLSVIAIMAAAIAALVFLSGSGLRSEEKAEEITEKIVFPEEINVYLTEKNEIVTVPAADYIEGCLAAGIDLSYSTETLKAQAAACATYALRLMKNLKDSEKLPYGADISDDRSLCQPYMTEAERKSEYGAEYERYRDKLAAAVEYGLTHIITYRGEPIYAVYHAVSAGTTCPAEYVWGVDIPYLECAESKADTESLHFECKNELRSEDIRVALAKNDRDTEIPVDPAKWFTNLKTDESGYVISVNIGKNRYSGGDLWRILGLRSTAFTVSYVDNIFTFTTRGFGHGVGLSQYGADALARSGASADEILHHYYGSEVSIG